ncbi:HAMP domain-containing sensor histidine kinase [Pseudaquabacterium pictum]|uniref:histidine kinase n=1 Tax=Pseudaquabacterium pictum TaxID=2315236 RepID=A0A480APS1_9BURK|nr:HAMP domain-containing sensor histidine kinase [Rubrivivax pictus]GCL63431.1 two-component sensor histidine kinase [Rubrivivax pictus]
MRRPPLSFSTRLTLMLAALLLAYAGLVAVLGRSLATAHEQESLQRLSHGLAQHIVGHWPEITTTDPAESEAAARRALLQMLMVVNPGIQVYVLDAGGRVAAYIGEPGMVRQHQVDLAPVRAFLAGAALPLHGTDPMGGDVRRIFSAAMFAPKPGQTQPPGYLYIVLDGAARTQVAGAISLRREWLGAAAVAGVGALLTLLVGALALRKLTRPLHRLAGRMRSYSLGATATRPEPQHGGRGDEVQAIATAFAGLTERLEQQSAREAAQTLAHRETMAGVAHDLRTPLTALHGHLEALSGGSAVQQAPLLRAALAQSDKVRRLSQQLFELATLQSTDQVLHRERFSLDELVTDTVQKFAIGHPNPPVTLTGAPPGRLELDGDLQLIDRALGNLIDNALRHAPGGAPVRVSLLRQGGNAQILVEDNGPGLPPDLQARLDQQASLRDPPLRRSGGGIGGLGLAIAQRVAQLHGGSLRPLATPEGGTRLCLALPLAAPG